MSEDENERRERTFCDPDPWMCSCHGCGTYEWDGQWYTCPWHGDDQADDLVVGSAGSVTCE